MGRNTGQEHAGEAHTGEAHAGEAHIGQAHIGESRTGGARAAGRRPWRSLTRRARTVLVGTGWIAVVALTGTALVPSPDAVDAGVVTSNYVIAGAVDPAVEASSAGWSTSGSETSSGTTSAGTTPAARGRGVA